MNSYLARQPILDAKLRVMGYELLFRNGEHEDSFSCENADYATVDTTIESFYTIGLDTITGKKPAYVNFTPSLLLAGVATLFPKELLIIELSGKLEPNPRIVDACRELRDAGYTLALDDFNHRPEDDPLADICKIIKIDFLENPPDQIHEYVKRIKDNKKIKLAKKIESRETFNDAVKMGFDLFQGYFFSKPVIVTGKRLMPHKLSYVNLLSEIRDSENINFDKLANIIRHDIALCHKFLRIINSVYYGLLQKVTDIKLALVMFGTNEIRKIIYFLSIMELGTDKPDELMRLSVVRGFFLESLSKLSTRSYSKDALFMLGIFSFIDVLLEQPMKTALADLRLSPDIVEALTENSGEL